jgi:hypothetical protein
MLQMQIVQKKISKNLCGKIPFFDNAINKEKRKCVI